MWLYTPSISDALALRAYAVWGRNVYVTTIIVLGQLVSRVCDAITRRC